LHTNAGPTTTSGTLDSGWEFVLVWLWAVLRQTNTNKDANLSKAQWLQQKKKSREIKK